MLLQRFVVVLGIIASCAAFLSVPVIMASHKLVKGLREEIAPNNYKPHNGTSVSNMARKLVTECTSDEYLLIDIPGLTSEDLLNKNDALWPNLRKYMMLSSTLVGLPWVRDPLDFDYLEKYIIKTCNAETINVIHEDDNEVEQYYDTRKRVIKVKLPELPDEHSFRARVLRDYDELIRRIIRKLPSPHYTIILSSSKRHPVHPVPEAAIEVNPSRFELFYDLTSDPSRKNEVERNDRFSVGEVYWNSNRNTNDRYLRNKKNDEVHLFNYDSLVKNEKLILTVVVMILSIFFIQIYSFLSWVFNKIFNKVMSPTIPTSTKKNE